MTDLQTFNTEDFQTYTLWISVATLIKVRTVCVLCMAHMRRIILYTQRILIGNTFCCSFTVFKCAFLTVLRLVKVVFYSVLM